MVTSYAAESITSWMVDYLSKRLGCGVTADSPLFPSLISSLELLELILELEQSFIIKVPLSEIRHELRSVDAFARSVSVRAKADIPRDWMKVVLPARYAGNPLAFLVRLRADVPGSLAVLTEGEPVTVKIGIDRRDDEQRARLERYLKREG